MAVKKKATIKKADVSERIIMPSFNEKFHPFLNEKLDPSQVRGLLQSAFTGDPQSLNDLYSIMEDTWPRLAKNLHEIKKAASRAQYIVQPFADQGKEPTPSAQEKAEFTRYVIDNMRPVPKRNENGFEDMIYDLCDAVGKGISIQEIMWDVQDGKICPKSSYWVHPKFWGYDSSGTEIMLRNIGTGGGGAGGYVSMPDDKFLIGRYKTRSGNPLTYGFSRVLAFWWSGMIFGRQWLMRYAQIFGIPLRVAKYGKNLSDNDRTSLEAWLRDLAAAGYAMIPEGSEIQLLEASKGGTDNPQNHLIDVADRVCDILILGQTLTTDVADSGSRALGDVHAGVRLDNLQDACDWAAQNINDQIIRKTIQFNYGNTEEMPFLQTKFESAEDPVQMATRDQILVGMGMELPQDQIYERHKIRIPEAGEAVIKQSSPEPSFFGKDASIVQAKGIPAQNDRLTESVMESLTGVSAEWLAPAKPAFAKVMSLAMNDSVSDEKVIEAIGELAALMPELFDDLDHKSLQKSLEQAMGASAANGAFDRLRSFAEENPDDTSQNQNTSDPE